MSGSPSGKPRPLAVVAAALNEDIRIATNLARADGFSALQLDAHLGNLDLANLSQSAARELRSILRSKDLELVGSRLDLGGKGLGPKADIDAALDRIEKLMDAALKLQSPLLCIDIGPLPAPPPREIPKPSVTPEQAGLIIIPTLSSPPKTPPIAQDKFDVPFADAVDSALHELGRRADRHGVMLAFRTDLAGFAALDRALQSAACPWFGIDLDPVAMLRDEWPFDEIFSRLGESIRHVRARDAILGADRRTKPAPVGHGSVKWEKLLADLDAAGFHGWITLDPIDLSNRRPAATAGATALRQW